jgi:acyl carrier protein
MLLAGGFYELWAESCTLDSFLDSRWSYVEVVRPQPPDVIEDLVIQRICDVMAWNRDDVGHETLFAEEDEARAELLREIVAELNDEFGLTIGEAEAAHFRRVADLVEYVTALGGRPVRIPYQLPAYVGFRIVRVLDQF